ncbi:MAG: putative capsid protein [Palkane toti-like virus]|nr:MAG: putative capsid protein [Palkane toti-like virus]
MPKAAFCFYESTTNMENLSTSLASANGSYFYVIPSYQPCDTVSNLRLRTQIALFRAAAFISHFRERSEPGRGVPRVLSSLMQRTPPRLTRRVASQQDVDQPLGVARNPAVVEGVVSPRGRQRSSSCEEDIDDRAEVSIREEVGNLPGTSRPGVVTRVRSSLSAMLTRTARRVESHVTLSGAVFDDERLGFSSWDVVFEGSGPKVKMVTLTHNAGVLTIEVKVGSGTNLNIASTEESQVRVSCHYAGSTTATTEMPTSLGRSVFIIESTGKTRSVVRFKVANYSAVKYVPAPSLLVSGDVESNPGPPVPNKKLTLEELYDLDAKARGITTNYAANPKKMSPDEVESDKREKAREAARVAARAAEVERLKAKLGPAYDDQMAMIAAERTKACARFAPDPNFVPTPRKIPTEEETRRAQEILLNLLGGRISALPPVKPTPVVVKEVVKPTVLEVKVQHTAPLQQTPPESEDEEDSLTGDEPFQEDDDEIKAMVSEKEEVEQPVAPSVLVDAITPSMREDFRRRATVKNVSTNYYYVVCQVFGVPINNRYAELCCSEEKLDPECDVGVLEVDLAAVVAAATAPKRQGPIREVVGKNGEPKGGSQRPQKPQKTAEELRQQRAAVVQRLVKKFKAEGSPALHHWLRHHKPSSGLAEEVISKIIGKNWREHREWTEIHWMAHLVLENEYDEEVYFLKLLSYTGQFPTICDSATNQAARLAASKLHNKVMHAYNGNTDQMPQQVIDHMQQVNEADEIIKVVMAAPDVTEHVLRDQDFNNHYGMLWGDKNQILHQYFNGDRLLFQEHGSNNVVDRTKRPTPFPCSSLLPREFGHKTYNPARWVWSRIEAETRAGMITRTTAHNTARDEMVKPDFETRSEEQKAAIKSKLYAGFETVKVSVPRAIEEGSTKYVVHGQNATSRLKVFETQALAVPGVPVVPSVRAGNIEEQKQRDIGLSLKKGCLSLDGFYNPDMVAVATDVPFTGICLEQPCLRWMLLLEFLTWQLGWQCTPQSMLSTFDPNVIPAKINVEYNANSSPVFGEDCGGTRDPVYPFGGEKGTLRVHLAMISVSEEKRASASFVPNNVLDSTEEPSKVLAVMAIGLTEWPFCMLGYNVASRPQNHAEDHNDRCVYANHHVSAASLVHVSGTRDANFILPSQIADVTGKQQGSNKPRWVLKSGPVGTNRLPANTVLRYCNKGEQPVDAYVPLTDFLVSWLSSMTCDDVFRILNKLNEVMPLSKPLAAMRDVVNVSCYMYPKLTLGTRSEYPQPFQTEANGAFTSRVLLDYTSGSCLSPHPTTGNFPLEDTFSGNFIIQAFDMVAYNQVILGLAVPDLPDKMRPEPIFAEIAHKPVLISNLARSVAYSICWNMMLQWFGASSLTWETHRENMNSKWIPTVLPKLYGELTMRTEESLAPAGYVYANLLAALTGLRPTTVTWVFDNGVSRPLSVFDRLCFTPYLATVYDKKGVEFKGYVPLTLSDAWMQLVPRWLPKGWLPYPAPGKNGSPTVSIKVDGAYCWYHTISIGDDVFDSSLQLRPFMDYYDRSEIPRRRGSERWNARLFLTEDTEGARVVDYRGNPIEGIAADGTLPWERINFLRAREAYPTESLGQSTLCIPSYDSKSHEVYIVLPRLVAGPLNATAAGQGFANRALFLRFGTTIAEVLPFELKVVDAFTDAVCKNVSGFRTVKSVEKAPQSEAATTPQASAELSSVSESTQP